ncbi:MAG: hypothetical protein NC340_08555 [Ruminococcus flavefaciens]|nr:hypothetical protein [Ruminococcus flavefaciens]MCM1230338.1 hypothetical protein [Ruminococcus flavefaciens]
MKSNDEMARNSASVRRCDKAYNFIVTIYALMCAFYAGVTVFQILLGTSASPLISALDGIIFKSALFFCGLMSCYKHDTKFVLSAVAVSGINLLLKDNINSIIFPAVILLSIATASVNKQYKWLENQFGFPYFNERFEEQNLDRRQREIKDEYQQNYERLLKASSADMNGIDSAVPTVDLTKKEDTARKGTMDDI